MDLSLSPENLDRIANVIWTWAQTFIPRLLAATIILLVGAFFARWLARLVQGVAERTPHVDVTLRPVLTATVQYGILILVFVAALGQIGIQTGSLLGVLGAAGLAVGLALQGTLSNIAAGFMLLWLRPFRTGDFIEVNGMMGTVREIGLFVCHLETFDGLYIFAPNSAIWNQPLRNHSRNAGRLVSINVTLPSGADIGRARETLLSMVQADQCVLKVPQPRVFVESLTGSGLLLNLRIWASHEKVAVIQRSIIEQAKCALEGVAGEKLQPQQVVRAVPPDNDPSRLLSSVQPSAL